MAWKDRIKDEVTIAREKKEAKKKAAEEKRILKALLKEASKIEW